ncbi:DUF5397 family protein [Corticimicrobacter populi]|uniref:Uncharacterized protein n=1 Tax=Corticimicrobacter populi TaxID=2175229 RepID=A0A2V1JYG1_9BURK|nr:DUF5397 family protein [Corticimicrobacter populi]PWF21452.1 hypothetical protein DD235_14355 [Corticimicrobacter populi]
MSHTLNTPPDVPVGTLKLLGPLGLKYEVGQPVSPLDDGDWLVEIILVETGSKVVYRYSSLMADRDAG